MAEEPTNAPETEKQEKRLLREKMEAKLQEAKAKIQELNAKAQQQEAGAKLKMMEKRDQLKQRVGEYEQKLDALKNASGSAWKDLKAGAERAGQELRKAMEDAKSKFG